MCEKCRARADNLRKELDLLPTHTQSVEFQCRETMALTAALTIGYIITFKAEKITELDLKMLRESRRILTALGVEMTAELAKKMNDLNVSFLGKDEQEAVETLTENLRKALGAELN